MEQLEVNNSDIWVEHVVLVDKPDLMIIIRHSDNGFDGQTDLVLVNIGETEIKINHQEIEQIAQESRKLTDNNDSKGYQCVMDAAKNGQPDPMLQMAFHQSTPEKSKKKFFTAFRDGTSK